jgi:integrase
MTRSSVLRPACPPKSAHPDPLRFLVPYRGGTPFPDVDLTPAALAALEEWFRVSGSPPQEALVFPHPEGGYLSHTTITRQVLYRALKRAGIPREGEHGRTRDFHSFRHSFARIALENGARMDWVQRQLGHSSITVTIDRYGRWERSAEKLEAEKLEGAFPLGASTGGSTGLAP